MRKLAIAVILCVLGILDYLHWSGGPARVHWVTIATHGLFLLGLCAAVWLLRLSWKQRFAFCVGWMAITAVVGAYLDSQVISSLSPLHPFYFVVAFFAFALEGALFLLCDWLIARGLDSVWRR